MFLVKKYKIVLSGLMLILLFLTAAPVVFALTGAQRADSGLDATAKQGYGVEDTQTLYPATGLPGIIGKIVGVGLSFLGVIFFVILVYAGIGWMLAMGKEEKINEAKDTIVAAVLGLIVVLSAYAITALVGAIFNNV